MLAWPKTKGLNKVLILTDGLVVHLDGNMNVCAKRDTNLCNS